MQKQKIIACLGRNYWLLVMAASVAGAAVAIHDGSSTIFFINLLILFAAYTGHVFKIGYGQPSEWLECRYSLRSTAAVWTWFPGLWVNLGNKSLYGVLSWAGVALVFIVRWRSYTKL